MTLYILEVISLACLISFICLCYTWMKRVTAHNREIIQMSQKHIDKILEKIIWIDREISYLKIELHKIKEGKDE